MHLMIFWFKLENKEDKQTWYGHWHHTIYQQFYQHYNIDSWFPLNACLREQRTNQVCQKKRKTNVSESYFLLCCWYTWLWKRNLDGFQLLCFFSALERRQEQTSKAVMFVRFCAFLYINFSLSYQKVVFPDLIILFFSIFSSIAFFLKSTFKLAWLENEEGMKMKKLVAVTL